jgi:predicted MFS family arabinose efflux permease
MTGLVLGTAAGGLATSLSTLMAARVLAGLFGGPATSISMSIVADVVPTARRGAALAKVMAAFSVAQILGVPIALELSRHLGWRAPFFVTAGAGVLVVGMAISALPPMRGHLQRGTHVPFHQALQETREIIRIPIVQLSYATTAVVMAGGFILIPNISAYVQENIGYPREHLWMLYFGGGIASLVSMQVVGRLVDRYGAFRLGLAGALALSVTTYVGFINYPVGFPVILIYVAFMTSAAFRNVAYNTLASRVPQPAWRARFMSLQSSVQHLASALGASASTWILGDPVDGRKLVHVDVVATISVALTLCMPVLLRVVEDRVNARDQSKDAAPGSALAPS